MTMSSSKVTSTPHLIEEVKPAEKSVCERHEEPVNQVRLKTLLFLAHIFGVHPFKGTSDHKNDDCCEKGSWFSKINVFSAAITFVNLLVVINHFHFDILSYFVDIQQSVFSDRSTEAILQIVVFLVAFLTLLIILSNVAQLHQLLHLLNALQVHCGGHRRFLAFWKFLSAVIFLFAYVFKILIQLMVYFFLFDDSFSENSFENLLSQYSASGKVFMLIDLVYYNLIEFPICQIPLLYLSIMALSIGLAFKENAERFEETAPMTKQSLRRFHDGLNKLSEVLCQFDRGFNKLLLLTVISALIQIIFRTFLFIKTAVSREGDSAVFYMNTLNLLLTNVVWTFVFVLGACVYVNETSRNGIFRITSELVDDDLKPLKDQVYQKLTDYSWGFTIGKFVRIERPLILTMISLIFTIVVVWLQFSMSATPSTVSGTSTI